MDDVPWSLKAINQIGQIFTLRLSFVPDDASLIVFWVCLGLYTLVGAAALIREVLDRVFGIETEPWRFEDIARDVMLGPGFIPASQIYFNLLACKFSTDAGVTKYVVRTVGKLECWQGLRALLWLCPASCAQQPVCLLLSGDHVGIGSVALGALLVIFPCGLLHELRESARDQAYQYIRRFKLITAAFEYATVAVTTFLAGQPWAAVPTVTVALLLLNVYTVRTQPCLASGRAINHLCSASYAGAAWTGVCSMIALAVNDEKNPVSVIILFVGYLVVMPLAYYFSRRYLHQLDQEKFRALRHALEHEGDHMVR